MLRFSAGTTLALTLALVVSPALAATSTSVHKSTVSRVGHRIRHRIAHPMGQRGIAPERATEIQKALISKNYLTGSPSGQWDAQTETAMQKYQADHGWQTKLTPDSRALIKLGLGPRNDTAQATPSSPIPSASSSGSDVSTAPASSGASTLADAHTVQN